MTFDTLTGLLQNKSKNEVLGLVGEPTSKVLRKYRGFSGGPFWEWLYLRPICDDADAVVITFGINVWLVREQ